MDSPLEAYLSDSIFEDPPTARAELTMSSGKKISKQLGGKVLTVVVGDGDSKREFVVHEELICESSEFFRGAMSGEWKEAGHRVVALPEDDPDVFALYLQAIYNGHVQLDDFDQHYNILSWASVYTLADKLMDADIKNVVIDKFYEIRSELWETCITTGEAVQVIYDQTPGPCGMRQLLVDAIVYHYELSSWDRKDFSSAMAAAPREFLEDLALVTVSKKDKVVEREPSCNCTYAFFDYCEKYLENVCDKTEAAQAGESEDTKGKKGKNSKKNKDKGKDGECAHKGCCQCGKYSTPAVGSKSKVQATRAKDIDESDNMPSGWNDWTGTDWGT
ncbi:hypothetical protein P171DRAFT_444192 [Karstenula rhodostoma CBS 690.94]|uniref:BTB domain-containing protein n=1 Tax=Karstenula rhodostoma CBS 690.94 TaxID=1392251 RepID=A0A9P4U9Y2_9PLEO|nr:hypothetical protein P171DRAFT_444192 [Karstenula rhodostoma CBS 690.94]